MINAILPLINRVTWKPLLHSFGELPQSRPDISCQFPVPVSLFLEVLWYNLRMEFYYFWWERHTKEPLFSAVYTDPFNMTVSLLILYRSLFYPQNSGKFIFTLDTAPRKVIAALRRNQPPCVSVFMIPSTILLVEKRKRKTPENAHSTDEEET